MSHETNIAWCAGFFDGEGHVSYRRGYPSKVSGRVTGSLHASVPQNSENIEVLEFFHSTVGLGKILGPYNMPKGKTQHRLIFGKDEVNQLFQILKPYLKTEKSTDFTVAMLAYAMHDSTPTAEDYARSSRRDDKKYT